MTDYKRRSRMLTGVTCRAGLRPSVAVLAIAVLGLTSCQTLTSAYRDISGASKDDPAADAKNTAALDAGSKQDYANLASVPNPPVRGLSQAERNQLAEGLVSDRTNAHYAAQRLASGDSTIVMPAQAPIPEDANATSGALPDSGPSTSAQSASASKVLPDSAGPQTADAPAPTQPADIPAAPELSSGGELASGGALASPTSASSASQSSKKKKKHHKDTSNELASTPEPRENPIPQAQEEPPQAPTLPPTPASPAGGGGELASGGMLSGSDEQMANVPQPAAIPSAPDMTPNPQVAQATASAPSSKRGNSKVFEVDFPHGSNEPPAPALAALDSVPSLHTQYGGLVRVVSHAEIPTGGNDPAGTALASYQAALARAQAVKQALVARGMPAPQVIAEVSTKDNASDRVDVVVEY